MIKDDSDRINEHFAASSRGHCVVHAPAGYVGYCVDFSLNNGDNDEK